MTTYYIVYKPDNSKNFFFEINEVSNSAYDYAGKVLDHIMALEDGDLANYEVFLRIM